MTTKKFTPTITRGPRLTPGEISLTPPDDLGIDIPPSGVQKILPYVMGGAMLGMIAIMVAGGTRQLSPYMLMMPLMMIVMMVGGLAGSTGGGGKKVPEINADRKEYLRYLAGLRTRVTSSATSQVAFFSYHAPHPEDLLSIVGTQRQWSRPANADFYAATRIGIGDQPAVDRLLKPAVGGELAAASAAPQPFLEPVSHMWVVKFLRTHGLIHDCPKLLQLRTFPTIAIGGDLAGAAGLMTAMICHLAVFHPPDLLLAQMASARTAPDRNRCGRVHPADLHAPGRSVGPGRARATRTRFASRRPLRSRRRPDRRQGWIPARR